MAYVDNTLGRTHTSAIHVSVALSGFTLMALEILAFRIIGKTFGTALRETSVVIAVFLAAMTVGYYLGGRVADRLPNRRTLVLVLTLSGAAVLGVPLLDETFSERVFDSPLPISTHALAVTVALFVFPTILLASVSPIAVRLLACRVSNTGTVVGAVSAVSTMGSILGSIAGAFVLIDVFESVRRTLFALAALMLLLGATNAILGLKALPALCVAVRQHRFASIVAMVLAAGVAVNVTLDALARSPDTDRFLSESPDYGNRLVYERDSTYHHVIVRDSNGLRLLYFDRTTQTTMSLQDPFSGGFPHVAFYHMPMILNPDMHRVLFIGLGGASGPKEFFHDYPNVLVDAVEVDPVVVDVAERFFHLPRDRRLRVFVDDGRAFLKRAPEPKYDLIVIDAYTTNRYGATIPPHLTTREFFADCLKRLNPNGMVLFHLAARRETLIAKSIVKTMTTALPHQMVFGSDVTEIIASRHDFRVSRDALDASARELLRTGGLKRHYVVDRVSEWTDKPLPIVGVRVLTDDYAPVDALLRRAWATHPR